MPKSQARGSEERNWGKNESQLGRGSERGAGFSFENLHTELGPEFRAKMGPSRSESTFPRKKADGGVAAGGEGGQMEGGRDCMRENFSSRGSRNQGGGSWDIVDRSEEGNWEGGAVRKVDKRKGGRERGRGHVSEESCEREKLLGVGGQHPWGGISGVP